MAKTIIVDSIMGSGKTSAMIQMMNTDIEKSYVFVTPYLSEVARVLEETGGRTYEPVNLGKGKRERLHELLALGLNIATTHALFMQANEETIQLIRDGGYTLVLDEAINGLYDYNEMASPDKQVKADDIRLMIDRGLITLSDEDSSVQWIGGDIGDAQYSEVRRMAEGGFLKYGANGTELFWEYPVEVFEAFNEVYVLTYLFEGSLLSSYMKLHNIQYEKMSAHRCDNGFELCAFDDGTEARKRFAELIEVYEGKYNDGFEKRGALSVSYLSKLNKSQREGLGRLLCRYREYVGAKSCDVMWTTSMDCSSGKPYYKSVERSAKGVRYTRPLSTEQRQLSEKDKRKQGLTCFVPCTARATNEYSDRSVLMYLLNRFVSPTMKQYYNGLGCPIDEDLFALGEIVQWVWRSAIRNGQPIKILIPSKRMRKMFKKWLYQK